MGITEKKKLRPHKKQKINQTRVIMDNQEEQ